MYVYKYIYKYIDMYTHIFVFLIYVFISCCCSSYYCYRVVMILFRVFRSSLVHEGRLQPAASASRGKALASVRGDLEHPRLGRV